MSAIRQNWLKPSSSLPSTAVGSTPSVVIDHGGYCLKVGLSSDAEPSVVPNAAVRSKADRSVFIAQDVALCQNTASLAYLRPFDKGFCVNWDLQQTIFDSVFQWKKIDTVGRRLVLSDPLFTPDEIRRTMCEVVFEEYEFGSLYTAPPALFAATARRVRGLNNNSVVGGAVVDPFATQNCGIVVDVGYSATHVVPIFDGRVLNYAVRRVDVGGKAMTNYMKELLSFRHFDVMEETHLVNEITEQVCFVARDFEAEMRAAAAARDGGALRCRYLLPNYADRLTGRLLGSDEAPPTTTTTNTASATAAKAASSAAAADDDAPRTTTTTTTTTAKRPRDEDVDQVLVLTNERIVVPELLMRPSDIGMRQGGVGDAILEAVRAVPSELAPALLAAIELVGGAAQYRNLRERIAMQVRAASDDAQAVDVALAPRPAIAAWLGAALVARQPYVERLTVARRVYDEQGVYYVLQRLQS